MSLKPHLLPVVGFSLLATLIVVVGLVAAPDRRDLLLDLYLLSLGGIALVRLVGLTRRGLAPGERSEFEEALRPSHRERVRIAELDKSARELELGAQTAFDFHFRLRPVLVEIAASKLAARGVQLADEERARRLLGDEAWEVVRPDRNPPRDRNAAGAAPDELDRVVTALERI